MNFLLLYRGLVRRRPRVFVRDEEFRLYVAIVLVASIALLVRGLGLRHRGGRGGGANRGLPVDLDHHDHRIRDHRLRALARALPVDAVRPDVRRWLGGIDDRVDQDRAPPPSRQGAQARARSDRQPGVRDADPPQQGRRGRAHVARHRRVHPPLRRHLGRRRHGDRDRLGHRRRTAHRAGHPGCVSHARSETAARGSGSRAPTDRSRPSAMSRRSR